MTQVPARLQEPSKENLIYPVNPFLGGNMKAHSALLNILFYVNLTLCTQRLHIRRRMVNRPGQTFCITHSPLFLKCCEQGNSNNPFPRLSFHPWPWQSSGSRVIPKPLQLKWHVPNGNPIVYVRAMSPFSWILFGPSGRICGTQLVSKLKRNFSPCSICICFSSPLELVRDWESASGSEEDTASPAWKELGLRHPLCYSWETDLCSQTPLGAKQWSQQLYRQLGFGAMLKISALKWGFWKDPQDGSCCGLYRLCSVSLAKLAQCQSLRGLLPLLQQNCFFP